jgi:dTMP kinase
VKRGKLIVLEGIDGSGTTTQIERVARELRARGHAIATTAQPSTGPVGKLIRRYLGGALPKPPADILRSFMALLFTADRLEHFAFEIEPKLNAGTHVLCDRYMMSTIAYQTTRLDKLQWLSILSADVCSPDLQIYLRVTPSIAMDRVTSRGGKREFYERIEIQKQVHANYELLAEMLPESGLAVVDGELPLHKVTPIIVERIDALLKQ